MKHEYTIWNMLKYSISTKKSEVSAFDRNHNSFMNIIKFRIFGMRPDYDNVNEILNIDRIIKRVKTEHGEDTPVEVIIPDKYKRVVCYFAQNEIQQVPTAILPPGMEWCYGRCEKKTLSQALNYLIFCKSPFLDKAAYRT